MIETEYHSEKLRKERAERILDAASEILLQHGYKRITIEDIAEKANVGKGTVYLHWKSKDELFGTLMFREAISFWKELVSKLNSQTNELRFHSIIRAMMLVGLKRPLSRALFIEDKELLGKLAEKGFGKSNHTMFRSEFLTLAQKNGLLRSDIDLKVLHYSLKATVNGFLMIERYLSEDEQISLEAKADALATTIKRAFEPTAPLSGKEMQNVAKVIGDYLTNMLAYYEQKLTKLITG